MSIYQATANANSVIERATGRMVNTGLDVDYLAWVASGNAPDPYITPSPSQDDLDVISVKGNAKLNALASMTPAQIRAWYASNVNNFAQLLDAQITLALAVSILARRL